VDAETKSSPDTGPETAGTGPDAGPEMAGTGREAVPAAILRRKGGSVFASSGLALLATALFIFWAVTKTAPGPGLLLLASIALFGLGGIAAFAEDSLDCYLGLVALPLITIGALTAIPMPDLSSDTLTLAARYSLLPAGVALRFAGGYLARNRGDATVKFAVAGGALFVYLAVGLLWLWPGG